MKVGVYIDGFNLYYGGRTLFGRSAPGWLAGSPPAEPTSHRPEGRLVQPRRRVGAGGLLHGVH